MPIKKKFKKWIITKKRKSNKTYSRKMYACRDDTIARVQEGETWKMKHRKHYSLKVATYKINIHEYKTITPLKSNLNHIFPSSLLYFYKNSEQIWNLNWILHNIGRRVTSLWLMQPQGTQMNRNMVTKIFSRWNPIWQSCKAYDVCVRAWVWTRTYKNTKKYKYC